MVYGHDYLCRENVCTFSRNPEVRCTFTHFHQTPSASGRRVNDYNGRLSSNTVISHFPNLRILANPQSPNFGAVLRPNISEELAVSIYPLTLIPSDEEYCLPQPSFHLLPRKLGAFAIPFCMLNCKSDMFINKFSQLPRAAPSEICHRIGII